MSKRRRGFPSESRVKRGIRVVHGDKWLEEKLGRSDPCPCGSGRRFQALLHAQRPLLTASTATTTFRDQARGPAAGYFKNADSSRSVWASARQT